MSVLGEVKRIRMSYVPVLTPCGMQSLRTANVLIKLKLKKDLGKNKGFGSSFYMAVAVGYWLGTLFHFGSRLVVTVWPVPHAVLILGSKGESLRVINSSSWQWGCPNKAEPDREDHAWKIRLRISIPLSCQSKPCCQMIQKWNLLLWGIIDGGLNPVWLD